METIFLMFLSFREEISVVILRSNNNVGLNRRQRRRRRKSAEDVFDFVEMKIDASECRHCQINRRRRNSSDNDVEMPSELDLLQIWEKVYLENSQISTR